MRVLLLFQGKHCAPKRSLPAKPFTQCICALAFLREFVLKPGFFLFGVKTAGSIFAVVVELIGIESIEGLRVAKKALKAGGVTSGGIIVGLFMGSLIRHAHGIDEPDADAAAITLVRGAASIMVRREEQAFIEIAHSARHLAVIDRRRDDKGIGSKDLFEHWRQRVPLGAAGIARTAEALAGETADTAAKAEVKKIDAFHLCAWEWRLENTDHNFNSFLTAPVSRTGLYLAKLVPAIGVSILTQLVCGVLFIASGFLAGIRDPLPPELVEWLGCGALGSIAVCAVQLFLSLLIRSFAIPVAIGLLGGIAGLMVTAQGWGLYFPYSLLAVGMRANNPQMEVDLAQLVLSTVVCTLVFAVLTILAGEASCAGAAREVREETGMDCACSDLEHIQTIRIPTAFVDCYIYHTTIDPDGIVLQDGETVDWRWVTLEELEATIADGTFSEPEIEQYNACKAALMDALRAVMP